METTRKIVCYAHDVSTPYEDDKTPCPACRLAEVEARARTELDLAKTARHRHPQQSKLVAEVLCDVMGWAEPEWVKK